MRRLFILYTSMEGRCQISATGEGCSQIPLDNWLFITGLTRQSIRGDATTQDGSRRRSPGGVFLNLIKNSDSVAELEKAKIFATTKRTKELSKRRRRQARRLRKPQSGSVNELGQFRPELTPVEYSVPGTSAKYENICAKTEADPLPMNAVEEGEISSFEDEEDEVPADR
ncbi:hypothetical protein PHET_07600 [Paragonimus heterotremus]|uniref:Phosphorylated adapter RNA export protein n=1 Tax=Paragonimus heterotremus TaxID=100268 RepID=A0A8J4SMS2_9TREM|nr:hypothetical protein PHET_07600 [Paragonimus heterotremus]